METILGWLGYDPSQVKEGAATRFEFAALPEGWAALGLLLLTVVLAVGVFAIYRREGSAANWKRMALATLRLLVLLLVLAILLQPRIAIEMKQVQEGYVIVMVDESLSMQIRDLYPEEQAVPIRDAARVEDTAEGWVRAALAEGLLENPEIDLLRRLAAKNRLIARTFSVEPRDLDWSGAEPSPAPPGGGADEDAAGETPGPEGEGVPAPAEGTGLEVRIEPWGAATDFASALRAAIGDAGGNKVAGVVVITDGGFNQGEAVGGIAAYLANRKIPVYALPIGSPDPPRNLRVDALLAGERVFKDDPVRFEVRLDSTGYAGQPARVVLVRRSKREGTEREIASERIPLVEGPQDLSFTDLPEESGEYDYTVRVDPLVGEITDQDNHQSTTVKVVEDPVRVLLVSSGPSWEYRTLMRLLYRDRTTDLSCWVQSADETFIQDGNTTIDAFPAESEVLFTYDVVILIDPDPEAFGVEWARTLREFVDKQGGGVLVVAGEQHTLDLVRGPAGGIFADLLPVTADRAVAERQRDGPKRYTNEYAPALDVEGRDHPITRLHPDPDANARVWEKLPGFYWAFPVEDIKPGGTALLRHGDPRMRTRAGPMPLLALHTYGKGRVVFAGYDETFRWRTVERGAMFYEQYWIHMIRHLTQGKLHAGEKLLDVVTDRGLYSVGQLVEVDAHVQDEQRRPVVRDRVYGLARSASGDEIPFEMVPDEGRPGWYSGAFVPVAQGSYDLFVAPDGPAHARGEVPHTIQVKLPDLEFDRPRMDPAPLVELTGKTGGEMLVWGGTVGLTVAELPDAIPSGKETHIATFDPQTLWDTPVLMGLLVALLGIEWFFRKRCKML